MTVRDLQLHSLFLRILFAFLMVIEVLTALSICIPIPSTTFMPLFHKDTTVVPHLHRAEPHSSSIPELAHSRKSLNRYSSKTKSLGFRWSKLARGDGIYRSNTGQGEKM